MSQPDLRTLEGARQFLDYHPPNEETVNKHLNVNIAFQNITDELWGYIPNGPGKTRFIHALNRARMEANSCIANEGA